MNVEVAGHSGAAAAAFDMPLARLIGREPVACHSRTTVVDAVARMHEAGVGSMVVADEHARLQGIFTLHDLRALVAQGADLSQSIAAVMTREPAALDADASTVEAVLLMGERGIRHVVVTRDGRLAGVVSERDLFALKRVDVVDLMRRIDAAPSVDALAASRGEVWRLLDALMTNGASAHHITRVLTLLNDHTVARVTELCRQQAPEPPVAFTWVAFGSEGRCEQTLLTDQDNGIVFEAPDSEVDGVRHQLLPLAQSINDALAHCGFQRCPANIMAGNPELCLSRREWAARFETLIATNTPENLLSSSIYFDLRAIDGPAGPVATLRQDLLECSQGNSLFRRMMAANAMQQRPPLGWLQDFATQRDEQGGRSLDLKKGGLTPFVDGARLLSLEGGIDETNTARRLAAVAEAGLMDPEAADAWSDAFAFLQWQRLVRHQELSRRGEPLTNRLDPKRLNALDRHVLKASFRQARDLQKRLAVRYQL